MTHFVAQMLFALIVLFRQTAVPPAFEVAWIKEVATLSIENIRASQFHVGMNINGSRADYGFMSLANLIPFTPIALNRINCRDRPG